MPEIKRYTVNEPYLKVNCGLGEGPFHDEETNTLRFVDIVHKTIHSVDLDVGPSSHKVWQFDVPMCVMAGVQGNKEELIVGGKHGFGLVNRKTGAYKTIKEVWSDEEQKAGMFERMRANDGGVDSRGRFIVGYMNDPAVTEIKQEAVVFRLDPDQKLHRIMDGVSCPNGTRWTADNKTLYFADSPSKNIYAFDYDEESGSFTNKRVFWTAGEGDGLPDGHCVDEEGFVWSAMYDGGKVVRLSPEGNVVAEIVLPTIHATCPVFVGEYLYITTATSDKRGEHDGDVFRCHVGVRGVKSHEFRFAPS